MSAAHLAQSAPSCPRNSPRSRVSLPVLVVTLLTVASALLSASTPAVTNLAPQGTPGGALIFKESSQGHACTNDGDSRVSLDATTCAALNELGTGTPMIPGKATRNRVTISSLGTVQPGAVVLTPVGSCTQSKSMTVVDLCSRITVSITSGAVTVFRGSAAALGRANAGQLQMPPPPTRDRSVSFTFTATLDPQVGNQYMGLEARLPIRWTLMS